MTAYGIRRATQADLEFVAEHMSAADADEMEALGFTPLQALQNSIEATREPLAGTADDTPVCLFGITPQNLLSNVGVPWMLGTEDVRRHRRVFLPLSRKIVTIWQSDWSRLHNVVDARNTRTIRWLEWLGFRICRDNPMHLGPLKMPFYLFSLERVDV